ncbi:hypothetical protein [Burkholderia vietnamiensis]|uniref:hypothetical protein n=1 Tax=Burkholderia vietnamiensis TaxID=60552 RepID=UPI0021ACBF9A|nr:hypothetical protein [Burkholderia vietnamiensis]
MAATERISMTMRELDRFKIIQDVTASSSRGVQPNAGIDGPADPATGRPIA